MEMTRKILAATVDALGLCKAQIAEMKGHEENLKADLIAAAAQEAGKAVAFEGENFRATVSFTTKRTIAWSAVVDQLAEEFNIPAARVAAVMAKHAETADGVPAVRVVARKS